MFVRLIFAKPPQRPGRIPVKSVRSRWALAVFNTVVTLGLTPLAAAAHWASYAYSPSTDYGFTSYQHLNRTSAEQAAMQGCGQGQNGQANTDCKVLVSSTSPLWMVIVQTQERLFWGLDPFRKQAEDSTLRLCRRQTEKAAKDKQQCQIRLVVYPSSGVQQSQYRPRPVSPPATKPAEAKPTEAKPAAGASPQPSTLQSPVPQAPAPSSLPNPNP
jgi:hypothetical protein